MLIWKDVKVAKGIKGKDVYKIKRVNEKSIVIIFNNGGKLLFEATMVDYDDCELLAREIE